jgi:hypothetical protein
MSSAPVKDRVEEKGSVLAELSLVIPTLVFLTIIVTDLGLFLQSYFRTMHIAREAVRTAVAVPNLEGAAQFSGTYRVEPLNEAIVAQTPASFTTNHSAIHGRVRRLLTVENGNQRSLQLVGSEVNITTQCTNTPTGPLIQVTVGGAYQPLLPINLLNFGPPAGLSFRARAEGSYLFSNCL